MKKLIVVKSGGDIATGIAHRLFRSGFHIAITEINKPTVIRRSVSFAEAVYTGQVMVENVIAVRAGVSDVDGCLNKGMIPVLIDPQASCVADLKPWAVVDAILAKRIPEPLLMMRPMLLVSALDFLPARMFMPS